MQAVILAAGVGNRISKVSDGLPKSYLKINGETLLERNLRILKANGINDIVLVTGHQRERFMEDFGTVAKVVFNPFYKTTNVLTSFWCALPYLSEDVIYLHADTVFHEDILKGLINSPEEFVLACDKKVCGEEEMKYTTEDGKIKDLNKSMCSSEAEGEFLGVCKFPKSSLVSLYETAESILYREEFQSFFEVAVQELIDAGSIAARVYDVGDLPWCEIDFPEDFENAKNLLQNV